MVYYFNSLRPNSLLVKVTICYVIANWVHLMVYYFNSLRPIPLLHFVIADWVHLMVYQLPQIHTFIS